MVDSQQALYNGLKAEQIIGPDHHPYKLLTALKPTVLGQLWQAEDLSTSTGALVSLHIINPAFSRHSGFIEHIKKQVSLSKRLKHQYLADHYGIFKHRGGLVLIATERLDGLTLAQLLNSGAHKKLSRAQKEGLLIQLALALDSIHAKLASPHRSLSPDMVFVNRQGGVRLTGYNLADSLECISEQLKEPAGYLAYRAPECFHPEPLTPKADIYAYAAIIYQLLSGKAPFRAQDDEASRVRIELKPLKMLTATQWQSLQSAFSTDPDERPATASQLIQSILQEENEAPLPDIKGPDTANNTLSDEAQSERTAGKSGLGARLSGLTAWRPSRPQIFGLGIFTAGMLVGAIATAAILMLQQMRTNNALATSLAEIESLRSQLEQQATEQQSASNDYQTQIDALKNSLTARTDEVATLEARLLKAKYPDADAKTLFTDQLTGGFKGPQMVIIPRGRFMMGDQQLIGDDNELPSHEVNIGYKFALARNEITFSDYDHYALATGQPLPDDNGWGRGNRPVVNVTWQQAKAYTRWLADITGQPYRLPTEAEWEYVARAGSDSNYWWGEKLEPERAVCGECGSPWDGKQTAPVGSFPANSWGIHDMSGNVDEWVEDCYQDSYIGAPVNGDARQDGSCEFRVMRGGSWFDIGRVIRSSSRYRHPANASKNTWGFRVALNLPEDTPDVSTLNEE
ncbi:SUMF1/EgtB/PvdO family nonheme iron enzyme [Aliamphritea hakodatensis]|uniref:SUMF1/EgtB/PvdO family nonheme iron enzyme n=1 Tax=Aliamphritea hakodatensis TaxID=2895352 RepID=UPI0022FD59C5|nr:SUMF1/EgtB/PvdO family nonheme iron enzyme [Aliamphritea hakodatensis]